MRPPTMTRPWPRDQVVDLCGLPRAVRRAACGAPHHAAAKPTTYMMPYSGAYGPWQSHRVDRWYSSIAPRFTGQRARTTPSDTGFRIADAPMIGALARRWRATRVVARAHPARTLQHRETPRPAGARAESSHQRMAAASCNASRFSLRRQLPSECPCALDESWGSTTMTSSAALPHAARPARRTHRTPVSSAGHLRAAFRRGGLECQREEPAQRGCGARRQRRHRPATDIAAHVRTRAPAASLAQQLRFAAWS